MSKKKKNLALIGARGAGKSKLSRKLTKRLDLPCFSTDTLIIYEFEGLPIDKLVEKEGWKGFRDCEHRVLKKLCAMDDLLIDCGGGILVEAPKRAGGQEALSKRKLDLLRKNCFVVYLRRPIEYLMAKVKPDPNRPSLGADYQALLERRMPWYEDASDLIVDLEKESAAKSAERVLTLLEKHPWP